jgi:sulfide:quinone oxidoreductase
MKRILILGAGTGGTIMANRLYRVLPRKEWEIIIVDRDNDHFYQPGFIFVPFGIYSKEQVRKPRSKFIPKGVKFLIKTIDRVEADANLVHFTDGESVEYDYLIVATGTHINPQETPGLNEGLWRKKIFDIYSYEGSCALSDVLKDWEGGTLVSGIAEIPYKCPVAPLEFVFLADAYFTKKGIRDKVKIIYTTPLSGVFTKPVASSFLGGLMKEKNIEVIPDFYVERVDNEKQALISYDGREVHFDLLTFVPLNMGAGFIAKSGLGDDLNYIPTNKETLQSVNYKNIFVLGDTANLPTSKAGAVIHFASEVLTPNILDVIAGREPSKRFDGHANCFVETGFGRATLIDFNYDTEPYPGLYPYPVIGPMKLLRSNRMNHLGKLGFEHLYWRLIIKGVDLPITTNMSMKGKRPPKNGK